MSEENSTPEKSSEPTTEGLVGKYNGDAGLLAEKLVEVMKENYDYRGRIREYKSSEEAFSNKINSLESDLQAYKEFGDVGDVKQSLTRVEQLQSQLKGIERKERIGKVAEKTNLNRGLLSLLVGDNDVKYTASEDGKTINAYVLSGDKEVPLKEFADSQGSDLWESLQLKPKGTPYPPQRSGRQNGDDDPISKMIERSKERSKAENALTKALKK